MRYISGSHGMVEIDEQGRFIRWIDGPCLCGDCNGEDAYDGYVYDLMEYDAWTAKHWPNEPQPEGTAPDNYIDIAFIGVTKDGVYEPPDEYSRGHAEALAAGETDNEFEARWAKHPRIPTHE